MDKKDVIKDLKCLEDLFDFINFNENHEIFSNNIKTFIGRFKIKTPKIIWIDKNICLRRNMYAFKCGKISENKLKMFLNLNRKK